MEMNGLPRTHIPQQNTRAHSTTPQTLAATAAFLFRKSFTQHMQRTHIPDMHVGTSVNPPQIPAGSIMVEGGQYKSLPAAHKRIFHLLNILGVLLQVKHVTGNLSSPFVTDHNTVVMLIADLLTYAGTLEIAKILQASNNSNIYELMNNISLLCGTLALVLLVLLLVPAFGWFTLACWAVYFVIIGTKSYQTLRTLCTDVVAYVRDKMKEVMRLNRSEEPQNQNRDA